MTFFHKISRDFFTKSLVLLCGVLVMTNVSARLVFVTEENAVNTNNFIINADDSSSDFVDLEFGSALSVKMRYDILNNKFVLNRDLDIDGDVKLTSSTPTLFFNTDEKEFLRWNNSTKLQFGMNGNLVAEITRISADSASFRPKQFSTGGTADNNPAFAFQQDTDTGMYLEGDNKVGLSTGGVGRLIVDANGKVGIGKTSPQANLHIGGDARIRLQQPASGSNAEAKYDLNAGGDGKFYLENKTNGTAPFAIDKNDNVGIGDTTPDAKLDVEGNAMISRDLLVQDSEIIHTNHNYEDSFLGNELEWNLLQTQKTNDPNNKDFPTITSGNGWKGILPLTRWKVGDEANNGQHYGYVGYLPEKNKEFRINTGGSDKTDLVFGTQAKDVLYIAADDGQVGIGDSTPDADLDVAGSFRLDGTFADKDGDVGINGQILSSTGTGTDWISNKNTISLTGRHYLYTNNRWTSWSSNSYGPNYYQWKQSAGTGADPVVSWAGVGVFFPKGAVITGITVAGRANNTEVTDVEQVWQFRYPNPASRWETGMDANGEYTADEIYRNKWWNNTTAGQPSFSGAINDIHRRHYDVNYTVPEDGWIDQIFKPEGSLSSNRYFYTSTTIEYILPTDL